MIRNLMFCLVLIGVAGCQKEKPKEVVLNAKPTAPEPTHTNEMPTLTIQGIDGSKISLKEQTGKILVICFNPDCDHCQREATLISANKNLLTGCDVYFVSPDKLEMISKFSKEFNLTEPNIHFARAEGPDVISAMGPITTVPTFFLYKDQKLMRRMEGEVSLSKLQELLF